MDTPIVFILDDERSVRESLLALVQGNGMDARAFATVADFSQGVAVGQAGCLLCDINLVGANGLDLLETLAKSHPHLAVIMMTGHADVPAAVRAMKAGATDFIEKPFSEEALTASLIKALAISAEKTKLLNERSEIESRRAGLTSREREILDLLAQGHPNKIIAYKLDISPRTVEVHRAHIFEKMKAHNVSDVVRMAIMLET
jgi:two-component system, LuxR family, response regulator FixJ